jgi:ATP-dependent protease ClpP protease subunit
MIDIKNSSTGADIYVFGQIGGYDLNAKTIIEALSDFKNKAVNIHIDSPGGNLNDAFAIFDFIKMNQISLAAYGYGVVGSAATIIMAAADRAILGVNCEYFIHNPFFMGRDYEELSDGQKLQITGAKEKILNIYKSKTKKSKTELKKLMKKGDEGFFLNAEDAYKFGFIDKVINTAAVQNSAFENGYNESKFNKLKYTNMSFTDKVKNFFGMKTEEFEAGLNNLIEPKEEIKNEAEATAKVEVEKKENRLNDLASKTEVLIEKFSTVAEENQRLKKDLANKILNSAEVEETGNEELLKTTEPVKNEGRGLLEIMAEMHLPSKVVKNESGSELRK